MISDKVSTTTGLIHKLTGFLTKVAEWIAPLITFKNIVIVGIIWFLIWYWMKGNEEKANKLRPILPYK